MAFVDQYAQSRHDARVAWAAADRWSRLGEDDSGADYDSERYGQDVQAAHDAFAAATGASRREYRRHRATGEAHRDIRSAEIDLQYVEDVAGSYVDWTAEVELHRRAFTETEATEASGRTYSIAAADDSYWRQEAGTFAAGLAASYPPSSSGPIGAPWGPYAAAQESAEAGWVTTTSTSRRVWEDSVADARKIERFDVAAALETRNNRLAQAWADREITKAAGRLQTARTGAYDDIIATLAGTRQQPLPRLPDCSPSTTAEMPADSYTPTACLPAFSPLNLPAVLPDDYQIPTWAVPPTSWGTDFTYGLTGLTWVPPAQLPDSQIHPVTPPLPGVFLFPGSPPPSPLDLSASLSSTDFPQYYNNVIDLIFGKWDFDAKRHLRGFRTLGTGLDAVFAAYASPPSESFEHLIASAAGSNGTGSATSGSSSPGGAGSHSPGSSGPFGSSGSSAESGGLPSGYGYPPAGTYGIASAYEGGAYWSGSLGLDGGAEATPSFDGENDSPPDASPYQPDTHRAERDDADLSDVAPTNTPVRAGTRPQTGDWTDNAVFRALGGALRTVLADTPLGLVGEQLLLQGVLVVLVDVLPEHDFASHRRIYEGYEWIVRVKPTGTSSGDISAAMEAAAEMARRRGITFPEAGSDGWKRLSATWNHRSFNTMTKEFIMELVDKKVHRDIRHRGGFAQYLDWVAHIVTRGNLDELSHDGNIVVAVLRTLRNEDLRSRVQGRLSPEDGFRIIYNRFREKHNIVITEAGEIAYKVAGKKIGSKWAACLVPVRKLGKVAGPVVAMIFVCYTAGESLATDGDFSAAATAAGRDFVAADVGELIFLVTVVQGSEIVGNALVDPQGHVVRRYGHSPQEERAMLRYMKETYDPEELYQWHKEYVGNTDGFRPQDWTRPIREWIRSWVPWLPM